MKNYKVLFWIVFSLIIILSCFCYLLNEYKETEITFKQWQINDLKEDIRIIDDITSNTNKSKRQIDSILKNYVVSDNFRRNKDTIHLNNAFLILKNDTLNKIDVE